MLDRNRNLIVGVTTLTGLAAAAWLIFIFGELPNWVEDTYPIRVHLNDTLGLASGSRVRINGIDIGEIAAVELATPVSKGVIVTCNIQSAYSIPAGSSARVTSGAFGGAGALNVISPTDHDGQTFLPKDGSAEISGNALSLTDQLADLSSELSKTTKTLADDIRAQLDRFGKTADKITELAEQYTAVGRDIQQLVEQRPIDKVDSGQTTANLSTVLQRADARMAELAVTLDKINNLLGDDTLTNNLRRTVANTAELTDNAKQIVADAGASLDQLTRRYAAVADDLSKTLADLDTLLADAKAGKGTLGKLTQDPALYNSLNDAAQRLSEAIKQATLLIEKWKSEGLPVKL